MNQHNIVSSALLTQLKSVLIGGCTCFCIGGAVAVHAAAAPLRHLHNLDQERSVIEAHRNSAPERVIPGGLSPEAAAAFAKPKIDNFAYAWCAR